MHSNPLPLLAISTPKNFSSIIQFSRIHINLSVLICKGYFVTIPRIRGMKEQEQIFSKHDFPGSD